MTSEVILVDSREVGRVTTRVLRGVAADVEEVSVRVVADTGVAIIDAVRLGEKRSGRGLHRAFCCPTCERPVLTLVVDGQALRCRGCAGHRTRRQTERTLRSWNHLGGNAEDRLLRAIRAGRLGVARDAAAQLRAEDAHRVDELLRDAEAALAGIAATWA